MNKLHLGLLFLFLSNFHPLLEAKISLCPLFSDNMVLQRNQKIIAWGWADKNERIVVSFTNRTYRAAPDQNGKWLVEIAAMEAGGPFEMIVAGIENKIKISNILIGDVWLCSGQSNMEWTVKSSKDPQKEVKNATDDLIRHIKIPHSFGEFPVDTLTGGNWNVCTPNQVGDFTAVGYFFARELRKHQNVPIGIVNVSWGASKIQAWMDATAQGLKTSPFAESPISNYLAKEREEHRKNLANQLDTLPFEDMGKIRNVPVWAQSAFPDKDWMTMDLPALWEEEGFSELDGVVWFRKEIFLSKEEAADEITLHLGKIDDTDSTYVNGKFVGSMKMAYDQNRVYTVPSTLLKEGRNVLTIWVDDTGGMGGIYGEEQSLYYQSKKGKTTLSGSWKFKVGKVYLNKIKEPNKVPTLLYNAMIYPIRNFAITGVLWYQGEENANKKEAFEYRDHFKNTIKLWRKTWDNDFPFFWVQLANYQSKTDDPNQPSNWALLRESQSKALELDNTGQAIAIDIGDTWDIHPKNKQDVGFRLSLIARKLVYNEAIEYSGPIYKSMKVDGNTIRLKFDHFEKDVTLKEDQKRLASFSIAGKDRKFVWAEAFIEGDEVVVKSDKVLNPVAVRYLWSNNPKKINFYNKAGLPAAPFRTDDW